MERSLPVCSLSGNRSSSSSMDPVVAVAGGGGGGDVGVGFINPTPLASRCAKPGGSSSEVLRSSWIQRLIPGVLGDFGLSCVRPQDGAFCQSHGEAQRQSQAQGGQGQPEGERLGQVLGHEPDQVPACDDEVKETGMLLLEGSTEHGEEGEGEGHGHGSYGSDWREAAVLAGDKSGKEPGFSRSCRLQADESSQHFSRGSPRRWRLKPPVSPVEPSRCPGLKYAARGPNMSSKQGMRLTSSDTVADKIVSAPGATIPTTRAIGLRDSALDCAQFMDLEPQCAKEESSGILCSQLNPLKLAAREVCRGVKSYSVESHHPSVSSSFLPYRQHQGRQQSRAGMISRPVLLEGTHSQRGQAFTGGSHIVLCSGDVSEMSPAAGAAPQLMQYQKAKQEVGTSHGYEKREGFATIVTENMIKEKDGSSFRASSLQPPALFEPFKRVAEQLQPQGCRGKGKTDEGVPRLTPLFPPLSYLGIDDVPKEGVKGCPTERLDKHSSPVLTPVYEPYKQTGDHSGGSKTEKEKFADKSLVMMPILPSFKSPRDQNELPEGQPSQCSSKTASLPPDLIAPVDLDAYDSINGREERSGQNSGTESKRHRGSSMYALQRSFNSSPIVMRAGQQIQPLHGHNDTAVRPLGFGFSQNTPHVPTASSRVKQSPTPSSPYRTNSNNVIDRSRIVKDLSTTQSLELAKSSSTQGTGSHSKGPAGQPHSVHNTQLEVPVRNPRGFYFPLSEGSCGSNPLVPVGDTAAGQRALLFQPVLSNGDTVSKKHISSANRQPVYGRGSRFGAGPNGEAELQTQHLGQNDQGRREARMELVNEQKEIDIARTMGQPGVRMDNDLQRTGDQCDGTPLKKWMEVSPVAPEDPSSHPKEEDLPAGTLAEREGPIEDKLQPPAQAQAWLQRWMPLSKPTSGTVKPPLRAILDLKASLGGHQVSSTKTVIGSSVRAEPSLPEASKLHVDGKSQHDLELQGSQSATGANQPAFVEQANPNVEGSFGDDYRRPNTFGAGVPSAVALAVVGAAARTNMP